MECELCNNNEEKDFIYSLNGNIICSLCGCVCQKKIYDDFIENYDTNYIYKKKIFYKKINYLSEILNKINSYIKKIEDSYSDIQKIKKHIGLMKKGKKAQIDPRIIWIIMVFCKKSTFC